MENLITALRHRLKKALPGPAVQARMSPLELRDQRFSYRNRAGVREGSVLILLYPEEDRSAKDCPNGNCLYIPFMQRPVYDGHHSGQISFPGGKQEQEDPDPVFTALREAQEEIGVDPAQVEVLGTLTELYIPPSNYQVLPVVGFSRQRPIFVPDPVEVADIIEASLDDLLNEGTIRQARRVLENGLKFQTPCYFVEPHEIWGATAMMLSEFLEVIREVKKSIS